MNRPMKQSGIILLCGILIFAGIIAAGCSNQGTQYSLPDDFSSWQRMNSLELNYPIPGHESNYRIIYINETGARLERSAGQTDYPQGTVIAKAVYKGLEPEPGAEPVMATVMVKDADHPDARGGWVWMVKNLQTGDEKVMQEAFCITCHKAANEAHPYADGNPNEEFRDYVFFTKE